MTVSKVLIIRVETKGVGGENMLKRGARASESREFLSIYNSRFINYSESTVRYSPLEESGEMLIITEDSFSNAVLPFSLLEASKGDHSEYGNAFGGRRHSR